MSWGFSVARSRALHAAPHAGLTSPPTDPCPLDGSQRTTPLLRLHAPQLPLPRSGLVQQHIISHISATGPAGRPLIVPEKPTAELPARSLRTRLFQSTLLYQVPLIR